MTSNSNNTPITQTSSTNNNTTQVDEPTTIQIPNSTNGKRNPIRKKLIRTLIDDYFKKISNNQRTPTAIKTTNINPKQKQFRQTILLTTPRANESWGANFHDKAPNHIRIYFQNVNSLKIKQKTIGKWHEGINYMINKGCDIYGFAETCTDWSNNTNRDKIKLYSAKLYDNLNISFSRNKYKIQNATEAIYQRQRIFQPGGCIQVCTGHIAGRVTSQIHDASHMGRWSGQKLRLKDGNTLSIITAYRPCAKQTNNITNASKATYNQQYLMLQQDGHNNPDPRSQFIDDMIYLIQQQQKEPGNHILVMLDANEDISESDRGIKRLLEETDLLDLFTAITEEPCDIPTYARGSKRIDYALGTPNIIPYIHKTGLEQNRAE